MPPHAKKPKGPANAKGGSHTGLRYFRRTGANASAAANADTNANAGTATANDASSGAAGATKSVTAGSSLTKSFFDFFHKKRDANATPGAVIQIDGNSNSNSSSGGSADGMTGKGNKQNRRKAAANNATSSNASADEMTVTATATADAAQPSAAQKNGAVQVFFRKIFHPKEWHLRAKKDKASDEKQEMEDEAEAAAAVQEAANANSWLGLANNDSGAAAVNATVEPVPATATNGRMRARFVPQFAATSASPAAEATTTATPATGLKAFEHKVTDAFHAMQETLHLPRHRKDVDDGGEQPRDGTSDATVVPTADAGADGETAPTASRFQRFQQRVHDGFHKHPHLSTTPAGSHGQGSHHHSAGAVANTRRTTDATEDASDCCHCCCCCCAGSCGGDGEACGASESSSSAAPTPMTTVSYQLAPSKQSVHDGTTGPYDWDQCECDGDDGVPPAWQQQQQTNDNISGGDNYNNYNATTPYPTSDCGCDNGGGNTPAVTSRPPPPSNTHSSVHGGHNTATSVCGWVYVPCGSASSS